MAQHVVSAVTVQTATSFAVKWTVGGAVWTRHRMWTNARAGETFVTNAATPLAITYHAATDAFATADVAVPTKDTVTGVSATAV